jgi:hypothetical protein
MPKKYRLGYFLTPGFPRIIDRYYGMLEEEIARYAPDVTGWVDRLSASFMNQPNDSDSKKDLEEICNLVIKPIQKWKNKMSQGVLGKEIPPPFTSQDVARVAAACVELNNKELFLEAFEACPNKIPTGTFRAVGVAFLRYGLESMLPK